MDVKKLAKEINDTAHAKGWYEDGDRNFFEVVGLMHSELSEALEEWRAKHPVTEIRIENGKLEGCPIEIADAYIRILDTCHELRLPIMVWAGDAPTNVEKGRFSVDITKVHYLLSQAIVDLPDDSVEPLNISALGECACAIEGMCEKWGIDLEAAVKQKMAYNQTRPYRHGGKLA